MDSKRLVDMEVNVRELVALRLKVNSMDESVKQLMANVGEARECQLFNERTLPLLVHLQLTEGLTQLVTNETQKT